MSISTHAGRGCRPYLQLPPAECCGISRLPEDKPQALSLLSTPNKAPIGRTFPASLLSSSACLTLNMMPLLILHESYYVLLHSYIMLCIFLTKACTSLQGCTALHTASAIHHRGMPELLLLLGANPDVQDVEVYLLAACPPLYHTVHPRPLVTSSSTLLPATTQACCLLDVFSRCSVVLVLYLQPGCTSSNAFAWASQSAMCHHCTYLLLHLLLLS